MIKELFQSVKSHFLKYASSLKVERHKYISKIFCISKYIIFDKILFFMYIQYITKKERYNVNYTGDRFN
ncbi:MAG: hypothetical protein BWX91_00308 [Spirochaetes bacterium ADurb.Bin133]|jgi:hypothetical protein|nr:MAG: hypothetical protein BWX91_00308 [Spirochaetes bacterium ADurb.Bin133]